MILEIEGKRVEVDDSFGKLSPEQQTAQVNEIAKSFVPAQQSTVVEDKQINPLMPTIGGAVVAPFVGPAINDASKAYMETQKLIKGGMPPDVAHNIVRNKYGAVENWTRQMHAGEFFTGPEGVNPRDFGEANRFANQAKYPGGVPSAPVAAAPAAPVASMPAGMKAGPAGLVVPQSFEAASGATPSAAGAAPKAMGTMANRAAASPGLQSLKAAIGAGAARGAFPVIGRTLAGGSAAFQGVDAYNRAQAGDYGGALIGGLGAIGSAASMIPHPITRYGGTVVGMGAEALNLYLDSLKNKPAMASGGLANIN